MEGHTLASSSDDEGPEEVSKEVGKAAVFEQQAKQSASRRQLKQTEKQRQQDQTALDQQRAGERSAKRKKTSEVPADAPASTQQEPEALPDSVIAALLARQSAAPEAIVQQVSASAAKVLCKLLQRLPALLQHLDSGGTAAPPACCFRQLCWVAVLSPQQQTLGARVHLDALSIDLNRPPVANIWPAGCWLHPSAHQGGVLRASKRVRPG
ncbi:hypothetical protein WJX84_011723 [Apatococcus fuscideae]|uniref:Uncharacterized protein n=1 Tax=Apatococcus fuscideae TaxID=2026836 RepID=A0AAW1RXQ2_9CHLO